MKNKKFLPYAAIVFAAIAWGFSFLFTKDSLTYLQPFQLLGYRFGAAAVLLTLLALCGAIRLRLTARKLAGALLVSFLEPVAYFPCETFGVKLTSASESGVVIGLVPVAIMLFSALLLKERLSRLKWASVLVCVSGVACIALSNGIDLSGNFVGVLALLGAVITAGLYSPASRKVSEQCTPMEITFVMMWSGAIVFNALGLLTCMGGIASYFSLLGNPSVLAGIGYLGIVCSIGAFFCMNYALSKIESTVAGTFINLVPFISLFAGVVIGSEKMGVLQIVGAGLILAGIWGTARRKTNPSELLPISPE